MPPSPETFPIAGSERNKAVVTRLYNESYDLAWVLWHLQVDIFAWIVTGLHSVD